MATFGRDNKGRFIRGNVPLHKGRRIKWLCIVCRKETSKYGLDRKGRRYKRKTCSPKCHSEIVRMNRKKQIDPRLGKKHTLETKKRIGITKQKAYKNNPELIKMAKKAGLAGLLKQQNSKEPTSIERTLYNYLLLKGILFEKQKLINGKFIVDAYIPSLNLVIEADGNYWHSLDRVKNKDKAENAYLTKCGFNLIRLSETEINNGSFKERLVS